MKCLKMWILVMLMLLTVITNYPQAMLKSECLNEDNMSVEIVDKIYKSKNNYLDIKKQGNFIYFNVFRILF